LSDFWILDEAIPQERARWLRYWNSWPTHEVFAHPDYVSLFMGPDDRAMSAVLDTPRGQVIFPFVLRSLKFLDWFTGGENVYDLIGPYGYGGAYAIGNPDPNLFWTKFGEWAGQNNIVSVFTRLSVFPDQLIPFNGEVEIKSQNIVRELSLEPDAMWMNYEHKVRKNVKRAQQNGLNVEVDPAGEKLVEFMTIYYATMERNNAADYYYFDEEFFRRIIDRLAGQFVFFHVWHEDRIISSELVLLSTDYIYSFLGGTLREAYSLRPNDLLKHTIIEWGRGQGKRAFVLGGGYEEDDGIFRYKKSFAPDGIVPFKVGRWIVNSELYVGLIEQRRRWEFVHGRAWHPSSGFFPAYRS